MIEIQFLMIYLMILILSVSHLSNSNNAKSQYIKNVLMKLSIF